MVVAAVGYVCTLPCMRRSSRHRASRGIYRKGGGSVVNQSRDSEIATPWLLFLPTAPPQETFRFYFLRRIRTFEQPRWLHLRP